MDGHDKFDNICISSQESDLEVEYTAATHYYQNGKTIKNSSVKQTEPKNNLIHKPSKIEIDPVSIDEESNGSDDATFVRQLSKPLIKGHKGKGQLHYRRILYKRKRWTKIIGILFIVSICVGILLFLLFILVPQKAIDKVRYKGWINKFKSLFNADVGGQFAGCDYLSVETIWEQKFPMLMSEGAIRLLKINEDDVLDIVVPFGTNIRNSEAFKIACEIYFPDQERCFGGLIAVDGVSGSVLWRYDAVGEMYALTCQEDLNQDGWIDCLGAGRQGTFAAVSGRDGSGLWEFDAADSDDATGSIMNLYTAQLIHDIDYDDVRDIIQIHGGDPVAKPNELNRLVAKILVISGKSGRILAAHSVPDHHESYYSPQILNFGDGVYKILVGTGGETYPGNLYAIDLYALIAKHSDKVSNIDNSAVSVIYQGLNKGAMTPPVLVDLNLDGRVDIVICPFGDECLAIDGATFKYLWRFNSINSSETYASPAAGYYNSDEVPDIFIQLFVGYGYPVYFYGETVILDGKNGKILQWLMRSNNVVTSSPLTVSFDGYGNDLFLYWLQLCKDHENDVDRTPFQNVPQYILSRANVCKIRFNTSTLSVFRIHYRHGSGTDDVDIYNSDRDLIDNGELINYTRQRISRFLARNPEMRSLYKEYQRQMELNDLSEDEVLQQQGQGQWQLQRQRENARKKYHNYLLHNDNKGNSYDSIDSTADVDLTDPDIHNSIDFESMKPLDRVKRHNGPHDSDGQQRLLSTGTLAPPFSIGSKLATNQLKNLSSTTTPLTTVDSSIDVVFGTYWSRSREVLLQTKKELTCNRNWASLEWKLRLHPSIRNKKFAHYDHDHYLEYGNRYCAKKYGRRLAKDSIQQQASIFNIHFGELTLFRKRIHCKCRQLNSVSDKKCGKILPLTQQSWPAYLGLSGNAYWNQSSQLLHLLNSFTHSGLVHRSTGYNYN